jgi:hyperosmotically inducible protein
MRMMQTAYLMRVLALTWVVGAWIGSPFAWAESVPEGKPESPPSQRAKDPDVKPKEPDSKPKESDSKPAEQKPKEADAKPKEGETKAKESETKPKDQEPKKEPAAKAKESEHKPKEAEQKPKEPETRSQEPEAAAERPCPTAPHATEAKPPAEGQPPSAETDAERHKAAEAETKKPMRSPMVTAKLALMADPRLFPYDIEVDVKEKDLVLLGKVSQDSDKRVAMDIVRCLEGVHAVENRLKVEADATHGLVAERDKVLTQLVKERFEKSKTLQSVKFDVKTEDGVVALGGTTRFQVIVLEAAQAARQVPGVRAVNTEGVRLVAGE